jgi:hypothetical protein
MKNDPNILAARRLARRMSHEQGTSHQSCLDEVARIAGRSDWAAFLKDPADVAGIVVTTMTSAPTVMSVEHRSANTVSSPIGQGIPLDATSAGTRAVTGRGGRLAKILTGIVLLTIPGAALCLKENPDDGAMLAWERRIVTTDVLPSMDSRGLWTTQTNKYITARRMPGPGDRRQVLITLSDTRPKRPSGYAVLRDGLSRQNGNPVVRTHYMGSGGMFESADVHGVYRLRRTVDCSTGMMTGVMAEIADDTFSPATDINIPWVTSRTQLTGRDRDLLCSEDILKRTRTLIEGR